MRVRALLRCEQEGPWHEQVLKDLEFGEVKWQSLDGVDTVFHLAGKVHAFRDAVESQEGYGALNAQGTKLLLEAASRAHVKRFIFFSSVKAIGEEHDGCLDEGAECAPVTPYGSTKLEAERLVLDGGYVRHPCVLRLAMVYGPGAKGNVARMVRAIGNGWFPPLPGIRNQRSMVHVDDVVQAALLAANKQAASGQTYIVTDGHVYSTGEIYAAIRSALGLAPARWSTPLTALRMAARLGDGLERILRMVLPLNSGAVAKLLGSECYNSDKIVRELGFRPTRSLADSLPDMIAAMSGVR